ncbi:hypothetical protein LVD15_03935 [Fulvivirga maritima]|uniref:hypothetical protein n=1 Tax=Fulvivirga maritima TaxID=2904247 RepID=UPI001F1F1F79|nr:hypothetical protein [Fulvivirga maritima]UII27586.1 hypothetical protein LVD15_03935 [Fulvivirga maritima]
MSGNLTGLREGTYLNDGSGGVAFYSPTDKNAPWVYNRWVGDMVPVSSILAYDATNQNEKYRSRAESQYHSFLSDYGQVNDPNTLDPSTVGNWFYNYGGPNNPKSYSGGYNYDLKPKNVSDKMSLVHDQAYDKENAVGGLDLVLNFSVIDADIAFVRNQFTITEKYLSQFSSIPGGGFIYTPVIDPISGSPLSFGTSVNSAIQGSFIFVVTLPKIFIFNAMKASD